jgi:hypothetical protein
MEITKLSITELKALFYDEMAKRDIAVNNLQLINREIVKRQEETSAVANEDK